MSLDFNELAEKTIQSQYGASPHIIGIVTKAAERIDPTADIQSFYDDVFNPRTARGVGLDVWGRIVGAGRYLAVDNEDWVGFFGSLLFPMNEAPFVIEGDGDSQYFRLTDDAFRTLIFLKAAANIGEATLPSIKSILSTLFGHPVYVYNIDVMKVRIVFTFFLSTYEHALFREYGILNLGAGVDFEYYQADPDQVFGFDGSGLLPMNQGIFKPYPDILQREE
jgi:hypothetical protein